MRWGSDWTFDSGDWWTQYSTGDRSPVYRLPAEDHVLQPGEQSSGDGFYYFWADAISSLFFPPIMDEQMQNSWLEDWIVDPLPPD